MGDSRLVNSSIVFIALVLLVLVLQTLQSFVRPFVVAIVLTLLLMPLMRKLEKRGIPFMATFVGVIALVALGIVVLVSFLSGHIADFNEAPIQEQKIKNTVQGFNDFLSQFSVGGKQLSLSEIIDPAGISDMVSSGAKILLNSARLIFTELFLVLIFMMFIIPSYKLMLQDIENLFGTAKSSKVKSVLIQIETSIKDYLVTKTVISLGTAIASAVVLLLFNSNLIIILAVMFFILNFIPNIGSFIAVVAAVAVYFFSFGIGMDLIWLALLLISVQIVFGNIIEPKITGNKLRLSPVVILLGLFFWGWTWGVVGMFLAVPLMSIIKIVLENIESTKNFARFLS